LQYLLETQKRKRIAKSERERWTLPLCFSPWLKSRGYNSCVS